MYRKKVALINTLHNSKKKHEQEDQIHKLRVELRAKEKHEQEIINDGNEDDFETPFDFYNVILSNMIYKDYAGGQKKLPSNLQYISDYWEALAQDLIDCQLVQLKKSYVSRFDMFTEIIDTQPICIQMITIPRNIFHMGIKLSPFGEKEISSLLTSPEFASYCFGIMHYIDSLKKLSETYGLQESDKIDLFCLLHSKSFHDDYNNDKEYKEIFNNSKFINQRQKGYLEIQALHLRRGYCFHPNRLYSVIFDVID